jgi:hypothetical protein
MTFLYDARVIVSSLVSATLVSYVVRSIWVKWQNARVAERLGCLPPPRLPNKWPLGIDIVRGTIAANQEMRGLEHIRSLLEGMGGTLSNGFQIGFIKGMMTRSFRQFFQNNSMTSK